MTRENILELLERHGQDHVLEHYRRLSQGKQDLFRRGFSGMDLGLVFQLYEKFSRQGDSRPFSGTLSPAPVIPIPKAPEEVRRWKEACRTGESLIRRNEGV